MSLNHADTSQLRGAVEPPRDDLARLQVLSSRLIKAGDTSSFYRELLDATVELLDADCGSMQALDARDGALLLIASKGFHPQSSDYWTRVTAASSSVCGASLREGCRIVVEDVEAVPALAGTRDLAEFRRSRIRAVQSTPLLARDGTLVGMMSTHWHVPHRPTDHELRLLDVMARQTADLLERRRIADELHALAARQTFLLELSDKLRSLGDAGEIQLEAARLLGQRLGANRVGYAEDVGDGEHIAVLRHFVAGVPSIEGPYRYDAYGEKLWHELRAGRTIVQPDVARDAALTEAEKRAHAALQIGARIDVPLRRDDRLVAVLFVHYRDARTWSDDDVNMLEDAAARTWDAITRARSEAILRGGEARQAFLLALSDALAPLADPLAIERTACRLLGEHLGVNRVAYAEIDGPDAVVGECYLNGVQPLPHRLPCTAFGERFLDAARRGETIVVSDVRSDSRLSADERENLLNGQIAALVGVMLVKEGRWVGVFGLHCAAPRGWTSEELALTRDVAERAWAAVERARAMRALRDADRRKDEFLATLAHELRNPLAPIRNGIEIIRSTASLSTGADQALTIADRQLAHMVRLVDDLLEIGRVSSGKLQLQLRRVELHDVLAQATEAARAIIEAHKQSLLLDLVSEPMWMVGDFDRLLQVFVNLLSNAAKYSRPDGSITVRSRRHEDRAVVEVSDTGVGIDADALSRVFELFSQASAHGSGGLGIGLWLARSLVELHGGEVVADSAGSNRGSTFTVKLPLAPPPAEAGDGADAEGATERSMTRHRIVVVDDNVDAAEMLGGLLELRGHAVWIAHDGPHAVRLVREHRPGIVFLDLGMPGMDGLETARQLRTLPGVANVRLFAVTGWGQKSDRDRTADAGFDGHLTKPVDGATLDRLLEHPAVSGPRRGGPR